MSIATSLAAQSNDYELEIADRLYDFEIARLAQNHDRLLTYVYPELFTLLPREVLREQMERTNVEAVFTNRLDNFKLTRYSEPLETNGRIFIKVTYQYRQDPLLSNPRYLRTANGDPGENPGFQQRSVLAIRIDHDLQWYFLEVTNGQQELLSSIIPDAALRLK